MTITVFCINFHRPVYHPGEMVTGHVTIILDKPKVIKGLELQIKGQTKVMWREPEMYVDSNGNTLSKTVSRKAKECYIDTIVELISGDAELNFGKYTYQFAVVLPANIPSSFEGTYGNIKYYGQAKIPISVASDRTEKTCFQVENLLDLNHFPRLKLPMKREKKRTGCCVCCTNGSLTLIVRVPRTGFATHESIPITVQVHNLRDVAVDGVQACLSRKIQWRARTRNKQENDTTRKIYFGKISENSSQTWTKNLSLDSGSFPNISHCNIIAVTYKLEIEVDTTDAHLNLRVEIPITIGDIGFIEAHVTPPLRNPVRSSVDAGFPQSVHIVHVPRFGCRVS